MASPTVPMRDETGAMLDLANLRPGDISFESIAFRLARINRFSGGTSIAINVAQHTLITAACAEARGNGWAIPCVLLHDAHEAYIGDITTPAARFIHAVGVFLEPKAKAAFDTVLHHAKYALDRCIFSAAGIMAARPAVSFFSDGPVYDSAAQEAAVKQADRDAYLVELRDFHRNIRRDDFEFDAMTKIGAIMPRKQKQMSVADSEMALLAAFKAHLPCFGAAMPSIPAK